MPKVLTLDKSLSILEAIFHAPNGIGTRTLAKQLDLNVATIHNIATTFRQRGYVRQDPDTKAFHPGIRLMLLGRHSSYFRTLTASAHPIVQSLADRQMESVMICTIDNGRIINLDYIPSKQALRADEPEELRDLAYCTAVGKVLLASLTPTELDAYLAANPLHQFTEYTITAPDILKKQLQEINEQGFSMTHEELCEGISAMAVPIRDPWGMTIAGLGLSAPTIRLNKTESNDNHLKALQAAAKKIELTWDAAMKPSKER
ncbi:MAG: IclR family transcriptional regulator [Verrucomicrobiota bacterium JB024]|nr:IclR family transcriptional regulator [Verrucomicrobiota bacterium JB024]